MATFRKFRVYTKAKDFKSATKLFTEPLVAPGPDQIRVCHAYLGVNAIDLAVASGQMFAPTELPYDIGIEALGTVDAIGSAIPSGKFTIGQSVLVTDFQQQFSFAEYSYKPADKIIPVPSLDPKFLVSNLNALTAVISLEVSGQIRAGDKVLITAASGGTGQIAVQWAKAKGCHVIGLTSTDAKAEYLKEIGADFVINYRQQNLDQILSEKYPKGVDVVWETLGGDSFAILFNHLADKGRMVLAGRIQDHKGAKASEVKDLYGQLIYGAKSLNGFNLSQAASHIPVYLPQIIEGIAKGKFQARVDLGESSPGGKFVGLEQMHRAQDWLNDSKNIGKVVVQL